MLYSHPKASVFFCVFYRELQCFFQESVFHLNPSVTLAYACLCLSAKNNHGPETH